MSRAGQATGKYRQAYNIRDLENGNQCWADLKDYEIEEYCEAEEGESESADIEDEEEETQSVVYREGDVISYRINKTKNLNLDKNS